jgi:hypothetical protein
MPWGELNAHPFFAGENPPLCLAQCTFAVKEVTMSELSFLHERVVIPVIDAANGSCGSPPWRAIWTPAFKMRWPDEPVAILDWGKVLVDMREQARKNKDEGEDEFRLAMSSMSERLRLPVLLNDKHESWIRELKVSTLRGHNDRNAVLDTVRGVPLYGGFAWGSMVKKGKTLGFRRDVPSEDGQSWRGEDGVRFARHWFADARYGACRAEGLRVKVLPPGSMWHGIMVHDGFGVWSQSIVDGCMSAAQHPDLIRFAPGRQSFQHWEKLIYGDIADEAIELMMEYIPRALASVEFMVTTLDIGDRSQLIQLNPEMEQHPWIARAIERNNAELLVRLGTTVPLPSRVYVVIPSPDEEIHHQWDSGDKIVKRYPIDALSNIRPITFGPADSYAHRLVFQHTFAGYDMCGKGCATVLPDEDMEDYDMVVCSEDIKLAAGKQDGQKRLRSSSEVYCGDTMQLSILQAWHPDHVIAIPYSIWSKAGGDFDGDTAGVDDASGVPEIFAAHKRLPEVTSYKLPKDKRKEAWDKRRKVIAKSMLNQVGWATNIASALWGLRHNPEFPELIDSVAPLVTTLVQQELDLEPPVDEISLWKLCNGLIKIMTDGFKTSVDMVLAAQLLAEMQGKIIGFAQGMPGWTSWMRSLWAFRHGVPWFEGEEEDTNDDLETKVIGARKRSVIKQAYSGSTIGQLYFIARDAIEAAIGGTIVNSRGVTAWLKDVIKVKPLSAYINWAVQVPVEDLKKAHAMYNVFLASISGVDWADTHGEYSSVQSYLVTWRSDCQDWAVREFGGNMMAAASALWRISHIRGGPRAGAGAVFMGFPDQSAAIVRDMPGLKNENPNRTKTVLVGFSKNLVYGVEFTKYGPIHVRVEAQGAKLVVIALSNLEDILQSPERPEGYIGFIGEISQSKVSEGFSVPAEGEYMMELYLPKAGAGWHIAWMTPV